MFTTQWMFGIVVRKEIGKGKENSQKISIDSDSVHTIEQVKN
jgi:hypothetical protein